MVLSLDLELRRARDPGVGLKRPGAQEGLVKPRPYAARIVIVRSVVEAEEAAPALHVSPEPRPLRSSAWLVVEEHYDLELRVGEVVQQVPVGRLRIAEVVQRSHLGE